MAFDASYDTGTQGSGVGNREQLLNLSTVLYPTIAPTKGVIPTTNEFKGELIEWTVDTMRDPQNVGVPEGEDVSTFKAKHRKLARLQNRTQHFRDSFKVSKKQQAYESVTPVKIAEAEEKTLKEVLLDVEKSINSNDGCVADDGSGTGTIQRGLGKWISDTAQSDGVNDVPTEYRTPTASIHSSGSLTEEAFNGLLASRFNEVGETGSLKLIADTELRNHIIDEFTRTDGGSSQVRYPNGNGTDVTYNVEMFRSPFGIVDIITANPKCMPNSSTHKTGYILDTSLLQWNEVLPIGSTRLEDNGGGPRGYVDCMGCLINKGPKAHAKITDFS